MGVDSGHYGNTALPCSIHFFLMDGKDIQSSPYVWYVLRSLVPVPLYCCIVHIVRPRLSIKSRPLFLNLLRSGSAPHRVLYLYCPFSSSKCSGTSAFFTTQLLTFQLIHSFRGIKSRPPNNTTNGQHIRNRPIDEYQPYTYQSSLSCHPSSSAIPVSLCPWSTQKWPGMFIQHTLNHLALISNPFFFSVPRFHRVTYAKQLERRIVSVWKLVTRTTRKKQRNSFIHPDFVVITSRRRSSIHPQLYRYHQWTIPNNLRLGRLPGLFTLYLFLDSVDLLILPTQRPNYLFELKTYNFSHEFQLTD